MSGEEGETGDEFCRKRSITRNVSTMNAPLRHGNVPRLIRSHVAVLGYAGSDASVPDSFWERSREEVELRKR
jgi:hypothetical protein